MLAFINYILVALGLKSLPRPHQETEFDKTLRANWRKRARALEHRSTPPWMTKAEAVRVLERIAYPSATVGRPPEWRIARAKAVLTEKELAYLEAHEILKRPFPRPLAGKEFDREFPYDAEHDVPLWRDALWSEQSVCVPLPITETLIQEAADLLGLKEPRPIGWVPAPGFIAEAAQRVHVFHVDTRLVVFAWATIYGQDPLIEVLPSRQRFHRQTARRSGWEFGLTWLAQPPDEVLHDHEEGDQNADLVLQPRFER